MLIPGPIEYLKTHVIAFMAGAAFIVAAQLYATRMTSPMERDIAGRWSGIDVRSSFLMR